MGKPRTMVLYSAFAVYTASLGGALWVPAHVCLFELLLIGSVLAMALSLPDPSRARGGAR